MLIFRYLGSNIQLHSSLNRLVTRRTFLLRIRCRNLCLLRPGRSQRDISSRDVTRLGNRCLLLSMEFRSTHLCISYQQGKARLVQLDHQFQQWFCKAILVGSLDRNLHPKLRLMLRIYHRDKLLGLQFLPDSSTRLGMDRRNQHVHTKAISFQHLTCTRILWHNLQGQMGQSLLLHCKLSLLDMVGNDYRLHLALGQRTFL